MLIQSKMLATFFLTLTTVQIFIRLTLLYVKWNNILRNVILLMLSNVILLYLSCQIIAVAWNINLPFRNGDYPLAQDNCSSDHWTQCKHLQIVKAFLWYMYSYFGWTPCSNIFMILTQRFSRRWTSIKSPGINRRMY